MGKKNKNKVAGEGETNNTHKEEHHENNNYIKKNKDDNSDDCETKSNSIVFKLDLHCEGCANKVVKIIRSSQGVEGVKCEWTAGKISVVGGVDPLKLKEKIEHKTHKKVELLSPLPKKESKEKPDGNNGEKKSKAKDNTEKADNKDAKDSNKKSKDEKKPKELPVTTAVLKVHLHCEGCIQKIHKIVTKTKGYKDMKIDKQKDLVMVTGTMDMKSLADNLKNHLKKNVEIVPAKNDGDKKEKGEKKDGGNEQKGGGGGGGMEGHRMQMQVPYGFPYPPPFNSFGDQLQPQQPPHQFQHAQYPQYPYAPAHAPQLFSDENPNACSVM